MFCNNGKNVQIRGYYLLDVSDNLIVFDSSEYKLNKSTSYMILIGRKEYFISCYKGCNNFSLTNNNWFWGEVIYKKYITQLFTWCWLTINAFLILNTFIITNWKAYYFDQLILAKSTPSLFWYSISNYEGFAKSLIWTE